ncbi:MAG: glutamate--tRNA ligase, partial [Lachnospiraceae bacterium]|nr:glutamate--tRNA ligase [Lachnospiraceae bacterium]
KAMDFDAYYELALPYIQKTIHRDLDLEKIAMMAKTRIEVFPDIPDLIDFFEDVLDYSTDMYVHKKMKTDKESSLKVLKELLPILEIQTDYSNDALYSLLTDFASGNEYKNGYVLWPVRTALSGKQMTPAGATEILEVLGKEESLRRIRQAIEKLTNES